METTKIEIDVTQFLPKTITRTFTEGQIVCPTCHGVGVMYGTDALGGHIAVCSDCHGKTYVEKCLHCGDIQRGYELHHCLVLEAHALENIKQSRRVMLDDAKKISYSEARQRFEMVAVETDADYDFVPVDDLVDHLKKMRVNGNSLTVPEIWGTFSRSLTLDYNTMIEDGVFCLHEDAYVSDEDMGDLRDCLDTWCDRPSVVHTTNSFFRDSTIAIVLTEEEMLSIGVDTEKDKIEWSE